MTNNILNWGFVFLAIAGAGILVGVLAEIVWKKFFKKPDPEWASWVERDVEVYKGLPGKLYLPSKWEEEQGKPKQETKPYERTGWTDDLDDAP